MKFIKSSLLMLALSSSVAVEAKTDWWAVADAALDVVAVVAETRSPGQPYARKQTPSSRILNPYITAEEYNRNPSQYRDYIEVKRVYNWAVPEYVDPTCTYAMRAGRIRFSADPCPDKVYVKPADFY